MHRSVCWNDVQTEMIIVFHCVYFISLKLKSCPITRHEDAWGRGGIARTHFRPRQYMGVSGERHATAAPGKGPPVPIVQEVGWAPEPV
jgi:hypothetical protein